MIGQLNERLGRAVAWLSLIMVLLQVLVVIMRYVFGAGSVMMQETIIYLHATLFMVGAGYALRHDDHVRCDVFYRDAGPRRRALIDLIGILLFLLPTSALIFWLSLPYVANAWTVFEGSPKGDLGIPGIFLLKTLIPLTALLLGFEGLLTAGHALLRLLDRSPSTANGPGTS